MVSSSEEGFERVLDDTEVFISISISISISITINIIFNTIIVVLIIPGKFCIHPRRKRGQVRILQQLQFHRGRLSFSQFKRHPQKTCTFSPFCRINFLDKVGEPFAEQPYAVAVQQVRMKSISVFEVSLSKILSPCSHQLKKGSHLNEEISRVVLELQKDRYFETLYGR